MRLFALTDHDTVDGVAHAAEAAAQAAMRLVPAVEISAIGSGAADVHVLGYLVDPSDPGLREALARFRADRDRRAHAMAQALRSLGFELEREPLDARRRVDKRSAGRTWPRRWWPIAPMRSG